MKNIYLKDNIKITKFTNEIAVSAFDVKSIHIPSNSGLNINIKNIMNVGYIGPMSIPLIIFQSNNNEFHAIWIKNIKSYCNVGVKEKSLTFIENSINISILFEDSTAEIKNGQFNSIKDAIFACKNDITLKNKKPISKLEKKAVYIFDMWMPNGEVLNDYNDLIDLIAILDKNNLAKDSLIYIVGWSNPYDTKYPIYEPNDELGGEKIFLKAVNIAKSCGCSLLIHTNFWGYDIDSKLLMNYKDIQLKNKDGEFLGWDGDTSPLAYISPGSIKWQNLFFKYMDKLVFEYGIDAIFLDQLGFFEYNSSDTLIAETVNFLERLNARYKSLIAIGIEVFNYQLEGLCNMSQLWGRPWCGLDEVFDESLFSPICKIYFEEEIAFMSHLGMPALVKAKHVWTNKEFIATNGVNKAFTLAHEYNLSMGSIKTFRVNKGSDFKNTIFN